MLILLFADEFVIMAQIMEELVFSVGILSLLKAPSLQRRAGSNGYVVLKTLLEI
jgi:hypothetical protein